MEVKTRAFAALIALVPLVAVGCKTQADATPGSGAAATTASAASTGKMRLMSAPADGDVDAIVRTAQAKAMADKRRVLVYVGATWCEPCQRFHHAAERGELDAKFPDVDLLGFDADHDAERLASAGYVSKLIPLFALPGPDGRASGKQVEGGIKGEGAVGFIAPRLEKMLAD
jgi:thiol-disulfide isomerase/thioredoxin